MQTNDKKKYICKKSLKTKDEPKGKQPNQKKVVDEENRKNDGNI